MKKILLTLILGLFLISFASAEIQKLGTFKLGENVPLIQTCASCTFNNITSINDPDGNEVVGEYNMTRTGTVYNFTLSSGNVTSLGTYIVNGFGDLDGTDTIWNYVFSVTRTGFELTQARGNVFIGLLFIMVFLFVVNCVGITMLPSKDNRNELGELISINNLKYLRSILLGVGYLLLMSIVFLSSNIALAYLGTSLFGNILFRIFQIMLVLLLPMFVIWLIFIFHGIFRDREVKKMINRGVGL